MSPQKACETLGLPAVLDVSEAKLVLADWARNHLNPDGYQLIGANENFDDLADAYMDGTPGEMRPVIVAALRALGEANGAA